MKVMQAFLVAIALSACGRKVTPVLPAVRSEGLQAQVERMRPLLLWGCGLPTEAGRKDCSGDGVSMGGWAGLYGRLWAPGAPSPLAPFLASIGADGRPWRASDRVGVQRSDSFSRDGLMGLLEATQATGDATALRRVWDYVARTGKLCPDATDGRCDPSPGGSPSVTILARDALGLPVEGALRAADEAILLGEASTVPDNYQAHLVARKIALKALTGRLTAGHARAAHILAKRYPRNLWLRTVEAIAGRAPSQAFDGIAGDLQECMSNWTQPGTEWLPSAGNEECPAKLQGHDLVGLAGFLMRVAKDDKAEVYLND